MSGKGKLSGFVWHNEYHAGPKKEKVSNCIYLDKKRICHNKNFSYCYLAKCFDATHCPYRIKEKYKTANTYIKREVITQNDKKHIKKCSLPIGCEITNRNGYIGNLLKYDKDNGCIIIKFSNRNATYSYPEAFIKNFLSLSDEFIDLLRKDIAEYKK